MPDSFTPPQSVADNARRALEVRAEKPPSQRGMTPVGIARARQLANRSPLSLDTVRRMVAYFDRHEVDKQGSTWDEQGKGWQAWMGWGGDEGRTWANRILEENTKMETKASRRHSEADMKLIRQARKNLAATMQVLTDLGDDGVDDDAPAPTDSAKRYAIKVEACAAMMTHVLAQTVHLYYKAHAAHWNVSSLDFPQYHEFFGELYEAMFAQIDPTAEFIRALGVKAPATLMELCAMMPVDTMTADSDLEDMLASIAVDNQALLATIAQGIAITGIEGEFGVQNYLQDRMAQHQKLAWMLNQTLMGDDEKLVEEPPEAETEPEDIAMVEGDMAKALSDRNATPKEREAMPAGDFVIPETRNFPVVTPDDIPAAVSSWGRYQGDVTFEEFKARLIALAQRKGSEFVSALPQEWQDEMAKKAIDTTMTMEVEAFAKRLLGR
jgi:DNA-binding ferritin-like protein